jgi:hypothetical protein
MSKSSKKTTTKKPTAASGSTASVATATGSEADYNANIAAARAIPSNQVVPMRVDLSLALQNAQVAVASIRGQASRLAKLPETNAKAITALPQILLAAIFAGTQIEATLSSGDLAKLLATGRSLRLLLLKTADGLSEAGLLSKASVEQIRAGSGALDAARDCVALSALFTKNAVTIRGKHAVTAAQIKQASEVGTELLTLLKPGRTRVRKVQASTASDDRDRLWTLALQRWESLWRAGAYLFGRDALDALVPPLQARRTTKAKKAAAARAAAPPAATPAPASTT